MKLFPNVGGAFAPRLVAAQRRLPHSQKTTQRLQVGDIFGQVFAFRRFEYFRDFPETPVPHDEAESLETNLAFPNVLMPIDP